MEVLSNVVVLSILAGTMIFLGLPVARLESVTPSRKAFLNALSGGILLFLIIDLLGHARELPWEVTTTDTAEPQSWSLVLLLITLFVGGLGVGYLLLTYLQRRWERGSAGFGPGTMAHRTRDHLLNVQARHASIFIAIAIGLYNFAQGLGIGQAGRFTVPTAVGSPEGVLLLLVGFALHNATKGLAVASPLIGQRPDWNHLLAVGVVAGAPTVVGTVVGATFWNPYVFVGVLTVAAGAMIFAIRRLWNVGERLDLRKPILWGVPAGFITAVITMIALEISHYSLPELMSTYWL